MSSVDQNNSGEGDETHKKAIRIANRVYKKCGVAGPALMTMHRQLVKWIMSDLHFQQSGTLAALKEKNAIMVVRTVARAFRHVEAENQSIRGINEKLLRAATEGRATFKDVEEAARKARSAIRRQATKASHHANIRTSAEIPTDKETERWVALTSGAQIEKAGRNRKNCLSNPHARTDYYSAFRRGDADYYALIRTKASPGERTTEHAVGIVGVNVNNSCFFEMDRSLAGMVRPLDCLAHALKLRGADLKDFGLSNNYQLRTRRWTQSPDVVRKTALGPIKMWKLKGESIIEFRGKQSYLANDGTIRGDLSKQALLRLIVELLDEPIE